MTEHHSSRRARRLKQDADRSQKLRDKLKDQGVPTTHQINRALAEGFFYYLAAHLNEGTALKDVRVPVQLVLGYALRILTSKTNAASRYDVDATRDALKARI